MKLGRVNKRQKNGLVQLFDKIARRRNTVVLLPEWRRGLRG